MAYLLFSTRLVTSPEVIEHRLPRDFDYHRMPAPWVQIKILTIFRILGASDQQTSAQMYEILTEVLRRADTGVNAGFAVCYQCVRTITGIYPSNSLLEIAAKNISRFLSSENMNLKYLGVTGLAEIVQVNPVYAAEHQMVVVDCLESEDETLKRRTLDLLYRMTNPQNVSVIVSKLLFHLRASVDTHLRRELVSRVTQLAERYAPTNEWYVSTMNQVPCHKKVEQPGLNTIKFN
jgi:AP-4 complex subunit epsilon-1